MKRPSSNPKSQQVPVRLPGHGLLIEARVHGPGFQMAMHSHPCNSLHYVVSGRGACITRGLKLPLAANTMIFLPAGRAHEIRDEPGQAMVVFIVYFDRRHARGHQDILAALPRGDRAVQIRQPVAYRARRLLRTMLREQNGRDLFHERAMASAFSMFLLEAARQVDAREAEREAHGHTDSLARAREVLDDIARHYHEPHRLAQAARLAGLSERQFTKLCRKITGTSFLQYVNRLRVERASKRLENEDVPVSAIAFEVGFEDLSTFYRAFRRHCGRKPSDLRKTR